MSLCIRRLLSTVTETSPLIASHVVKNSSDVSISSLTSFDVLGNGSLLKISLAPSTPLYARRNSFVACFGQLDSIVSTLHFSRLLARLISWQRPFGFQKFISTSPVSTLISCSRKSFSVLALDGTIDWVIPSSDALHTYSGESLIVAPRSKWRVRRGNPAFNHTFLTGRGTVALASNGHTYRVVLQPRESLLVNRNNLLAYSVDANNLNASLPSPVSLLYSLSVPGTSRWSKFKNWISQLVRADPNKYYMVTGPTTLLLQSQTRAVEFGKSIHSPFGTTSSIHAPTKLETALHDYAAQIVAKEEQEMIDARASGLSGQPRDHFKIATVGPDGKVSFETTESFRDFR